MPRRSPLHASFIVGLTIVGAAGLVHCSGGDDANGDGASSGGAGDGGNGTGSSSGASSGTSGGSSGNSGADGGVDANKPPRCDPTKPFANEMKLLEGSFRVDQSARLTADELTLYFAGYGHADINGQTELWVANRASTNVPFKNPSKVTELSTADSELYPTVTADGLTMYYQGRLPSDPDAGYGTLKTTRGTTSAPWGPPSMLTGFDLSMLYVSHDGTRLYGTKDLPGGPPTTTQIRYADLPYDGGPTQLVTITPGGGQKYWPVMSADGLTLYYSYPMINPFRWELGMIKRATVNDAFTQFTKVSEVDDGGADERAMWISKDNCVLYFQRGNANIPDNAAGFFQVTRGF